MTRAILTACVAALLLVPATASAGTVTARLGASQTSDKYPSFVEVPLYGFRADPGEANEVRVSARPGGTIRIEDAVDLRAPSECRAVDPRTVECPDSYAGGGRTVRFEADLADGDDSVEVAAFVFLDADGGPGDDRLVAPSSGGTLRGGPGADNLDGGSGPAQLDGGPGPDRLDPGTGRSSVIYADRTAGVRVDLAGSEIAGEPGEGDRLLPGFEGVAGGAGPDLLRAAPGGSGLSGGAGEDLLDGGPGADTLDSGPGADTVLGAGGDDTVRSSGPDVGPDRLDAGPGNDWVTGSGGADRLVGGPGRDVLSGGEGVDRIEARDGERDDVRCDPSYLRGAFVPADFAQLDSRDLLGACGEIDRSGSPRADLVIVRTPPPSGPPRIPVVLSCPARTASCRGSLSVSVSRGPPRRRTFRIRGGRRTTVDAPYRLGRRTGAGAAVVLRARDRRGRIHVASLGTGVGPR